MIDSPFFLSEATVQALGWTLLHSLWEGTAIAVILWLVLPRLKNSNQRYWFSYASLLSMLAVAVITFMWVYNTSSAAAPLVQVWSEGGVESSISLAPAVSNVSSTFWSAFTQWLEPYQTLIVSIWLLGFLFFLIQLGGGLHFMYRLRRQQNQLAAPFWQEKIQELATRVGCNQAVGLLESALVKVPMALGFFKPLILLPIGMVNQLSEEQVEAILAHELAHIARRDWLFNLFQALIEALFYYHPAVWWISANVRSERENCCDDTAVDLTGNPLAYAKTLVFLQDVARQPALPSLALSMQGASGWLRRRPMLLQRIQRILHQPQQSTSLMEKTIALAILVALLTLITLRANTPPALVESIRELAEKPMLWLAQTNPDALAFQAAADSVPKPKQKQRIVREDDDQLVEMELDGGAITQLKIDGKVIPPEQYSAYENLTNDLRREVPPPPPPAAPLAPRAPSNWVSPAPPAAPFPPRSSSRISTEKDDAGNTLIRLERNGKPLEIRVKDGEVWVDDKKIESGESLDIPGDNNQSLFWNDGNRSFSLEGQRLRFSDENGETMEFFTPPPPPNAPHLFQFDSDGNHFIFEGPDGVHFEMPNIELDHENVMRLRKGALLEQRQQLQEIEEQMKVFEKEWKKNRREWSKEQQAQFRALEEAQRAQRDAQRAQRDALRHQENYEVRIREQARRSQDQQRIVLRDSRRGEPVSVFLQNALVKDRLITDSGNYSLELSSKHMKVNGKKQSDAVHKKYLELYHSKAGKEIGKDKIRIEVKN